MDQRFPKRLRLVRQADFERVFRSGAVVADGQLVLHALRGEEGSDLRIGISVSKRVGNAPTRNRWKRLIREAFRKHRHRLPQGLDIVVRPKKGALPDYHKIVESLLRQCQKVRGRLA